MDVEQALEALKRAAGRRAQADLADAVGVSETTINRWVDKGGVPSGNNKEKLIVWAERQAAIPQDSDPLTQLVHEGAREQGEWLLGYTVRVLRTLANKMEAEGFTMPVSVLPSAMSRRSGDQGQSGTG